MTSSKKWSDEAWEAAAPVYNEILRHGFVRELAVGTLPVEKFAFYLAQDSLYLADYARVLAHIASRLTDKDMIADFARFASHGIEVETAMHATFLSRYGVRPQAKAPGCMLYTSVLKSQAYNPVEVELAAVLPCFKVYLEVGKAIAAQAAEGNPYAMWIGTYADPTFEASTVRALEIADELAAKASPEVRREMTEAFVMCTRMEWMFWDSAYMLENWKI